MRRLLLTTSTLLLLACQPKDGGAPDDTDTSTLNDNDGVKETLGTAGCNNIDTTSCLLPFPSDAYLDKSGDKPHLNLPAEGMPGAATGGTFDPTAFNKHAGFGMVSPILFRLPGAQLPAHPAPDQPDEGLADDSPTVLIDATTGERLAHWVERDWISDLVAQQADPSTAHDPLFTIRAAAGFERGHTIVVGLRGFKDASGALIEAPESFTSLRDKQASHYLGVHDQRTTYEDVVFPALEAAGVAREDLQLAWSFTIAPDEDATSTLVNVRNIIYNQIYATGPAYEVKTVYDCTGADPDDLAAANAAGICGSGIAYAIDAVMHVPSVMGAPAERGIRHIQFDEDGMPKIVGEEDINIRIQFPESAFTAAEPVGVLQYGHGLLGSMSEANNGWLRQMANRLGFVIVACDMQGMSEKDGLIWAGTLAGNAGLFPSLAELGMQGVVNELVLQHLMATGFTKETDPRYTNAGHPVYDPSKIWYYGNSQGGSVGNIVMATSLDATRGVLGVPGGAYPMLLQRSSDFSGGTPNFLDTIRSYYPAPDDVPFFLALVGTGWDAFEPFSFATHIHDNPLPDTPNHEVLLHVANGDHQVNNQISYMLARTIGSTHPVPVYVPVSGLASSNYPDSSGNVMVEVGFGIPPNPDPSKPMPLIETLTDGSPATDDGDTHGWLRKWEPAQDQLFHFLQTGIVIDVCDGAPCEHIGEP